MTIIAGYDSICSSRVMSFKDCVMSEKLLSDNDKMILLEHARQSLEAHFGLPVQEQSDVPESLFQPGVTFVTLTKDGELRGCVGALEAYQPLYDDVQEHALAAAFNDYRFPPLKKEELPDINIEISRLTQPSKLNYSKPDDLIGMLRPKIDGVVIQDGGRRATFLPQVWEKIPDTETFLCHLCAKMGADPYLWKVKHLTVSIYQVEEFHE